jgi:hypothetical protein
MNGNTQEEKHDQLDDMPVSAILHALADKCGCAIPRNGDPRMLKLREDSVGPLQAHQPRTGAIRRELHAMPTPSRAMSGIVWITCRA